MLSASRSGKADNVFDIELVGRSLTDLLVTLQRRARSRGRFSSERVRGVDVVKAEVRVKQSRTGLPRVRWGPESAFPANWSGFFNQEAIERRYREAC
jgi:hypothetical protein